MKTTPTQHLIIKELTKQDVSAVVRIQNESWHQYYSQYPIYSVIKETVTEESLAEDWNRFLSDSTAEHSSLVVGSDRCAFVALVDAAIVGVAAASSYVEGKWPPVDELLRGADGKLTKTAKFQELYVKAEMRRYGVGRHLSVARADAMLAKGYSAIFLATYADAHLTTEYHLKNGLKLVHEYMSLQTFSEGRKVKIACFLDPDLLGYRNRLQAALQEGTNKGRVLPIADVKVPSKF